METRKLNKHNTVLWLQAGNTGTFATFIFLSSRNSLLDLNFCFTILYFPFPPFWLFLLSSPVAKLIHVESDSLGSRTPTSKYYDGSNWAIHPFTHILCCYSFIFNIFSNNCCPSFLHTCPPTRLPPDAHPAVNYGEYLKYFCRQCPWH